MNRIAGILAISILLASAAYAQQQESPDSKAIRSCFAAYKDAVINHKGDAALAVVNKATLTYYSRMKDLALKAGEPEVRKLDTMDKLTVLTLRHRFSREELESMTPAAIFVTGVNQGWIGREGVDGIELGPVRVMGEWCTARVVAAGKLTPLTYYFTREDTKWKIGVTSVLPLMDRAIKTLVSREGLDEDTLILTLIEQSSGRKVSPAIWNPVIN